MNCNEIQNLYEHDTKLNENLLNYKSIKWKQLCIKKYEEELKNIQIKKQKHINNINRKVVYNPYNINIISNANSLHMKRALKGTSMESLSDYLIEAEKVYNVNAFFLAGLVANESGWNTSYRAKSQNNVTGHRVYTSLSRGSSFDSKEECIMKTAQMLRQNYLDTDGEHYNGLSIWNINLKYCQKSNKPNMQWSETINSIAYRLVDRANK